ncbi:MAG: general secretion pathway protein GspB [Lysobacteraceae bacterium]
MSLILEALRKSEAERRIGRAPDLLTPMPQARGASARGSGWRWLLVILVVLLILGAVGAAWWLGRQAAPPVVGQQEVVAAPPVPQETPSPVTQTPPPAATPAGQPASSVPTAPAQPATPPPAVHYPQDPDFASTERESLPVMPPGISLPATPSPLPSVPAPAPAPAPVEASDLPWLPRLHHLDAAEREGLPPLKMSMHVFNEEPQRRFAMIDGQRHVEGARLAEGVILREIRRDGVVLELRGRQVLIERP